MAENAIYTDTIDKEKTVIRAVTGKEKITLNDAILLAGFPGPGLVGSMSASYIIEQQKMRQIAYVDSDFITPGVMYIGGKLRHPFRVYANDEGTACVLVCDAPILMSGIRPLLNSVVKWAKNSQVREIMVIEGIAAQSIPEKNRKPIVLTSDGKTCDDHCYLSRMKENSNNEKGFTAPPAFIVGIAGGLLAACLSNGIPCTGLFIPTISGIPDPEGAAILIEKANEVADNPFKIEVRQLRKEAQELKRQMQELISSIRQQQEQQNEQSQFGRGGGNGMYS
jgi:uncharacterized protein